MLSFSNLVGLGGPRESIKLQPYQNMLYLHPPQEFEHLESEAASDATLGGTVTLSLHKARAIASVVVKLVAYYTVAIPGHPSETGVLDEFATTLAVPHWLDKGEHTYAWQLRIPRTSAPYERCAFGQVSHKLHAVVESPEGTAATVKTDVPMGLIVNPAAEGETFGMNERLEGFHDEVGPYLMTLSAEHVTVGGALRFTLALAAVPADTRVHAISAQIAQTYVLRSPAKPGRAAEPAPAPHTRPVFVLDARAQLQGRTAVSVRSKNNSAAENAHAKDDSVLAFVPQGGSVEVSHVARLPDDDLLRPSTHPSTAAPINIAHRVLLEVRFSIGTAQSGVCDSEVRALRAERPIVVSSCCCMLESLLLPSYADAVANTSEQPGGSTGKSWQFNPQAGSVSRECVCGLKLERFHVQPLREDRDSGTVFVGNKIDRGVVVPPPGIAAS